MSIRVSLYDFFAYMIPGVFYILVALFGLIVFNVLPLNLSALLADVSLFTFLILLGAGYVLGQLMDVVAYRWLRLWKGRGRDARKKAFLAVITLFLSAVALDRSHHRRYSFFILILELFTTHYLLQENLLHAKIKMKQADPEPISPVAEDPEPLAEAESTPETNETD